MPTNKTPHPGLFTRYRRLSLGTRILLWMILGIVAGIAFGREAVVVAPLGQLFIRLLMMAAIPLVFFNLLAGITSLSDVRSLGRLGLKIGAFYSVTTATALTLGLITMNWLMPGVGVSLRQPVQDEVGNLPGLQDVILELVPGNVFEAFSAGRMIQVVVFALLLGIATLMLPSPEQRRLRDLFDLLTRLMRQLVELILRLSPIGIAALAAAMIGEHGSAIFGPMTTFIVGVWGAQATMVLFYLLLLYGFTHRSPWKFLKLSAPLYATTAATCSSLASLVVSLDIAEKKLQLPRSVYSFTLPLGAQMNKDGTSIMLSGVLVMTAQATGIEFSLGSQVTIILVGLLLSTGAGGIPGSGLVTAMIFVQAFNLPLEIAAIVGGIYRLIDMGSTTVNCMGDLVGTTIVCDSETHASAAGAESSPGDDRFGVR